MTKGTPCSLSGTSAASSGHVLHTPCTAVKHWLVALVSVFDYNLMCQWHPEMLSYSKTLALPSCYAHHALYKSRRDVERVTMLTFGSY